VTACFVPLTPEQRAAGCYTLASASILLSDLPAATTKKLPRYPSGPAVRRRRLAVDRSFQGQGLGGALLADALARAARSESAAFRLVVEAKDGSAVAFYRHHGFIALPDPPLTLFLPLATMRQPAKAQRDRAPCIHPRPGPAPIEATSDPCSPPTFLPPLG
jgi:N-acetylglutamate synthase-like GNAT family acetyltransferase